MPSPIPSTPVDAVNPNDAIVQAPAQPIPQTDKPPVEAANQPIVIDATDVNGRFDLAVQDYIDRVLNPPSAAKAIRPTVPSTDSPYLDAAAKSLLDASNKPGISPQQKTALLSLLLEVDRMRKDTSGIDEVAALLNKPSEIAVNPTVAQSPAVAQAPAVAQTPVINPSTMPNDYAGTLALVNAEGEIKESQEMWDKEMQIAGNAANGSVSNEPHPSPAQQNPYAGFSPSQGTKAVSFESVLEKLPEEARPLSNVGWDAYSIPKTHKWIKEQLAGAQMQVTVEIVSVKLIRIPDANDPDETAAWELDLTTKPESFHAFGIDTFNWPATWEQDISGKMWRGGEVRFPVAEDFARQARHWRVGDSVVLSGTVQDIAVEGGMTNLAQPCGRFTTIFQNVHVDRVIPQGNQQ